MHQVAPNPSPDTAETNWYQRVVATYRQDHQNPVNHVLHVGVGWPLMALAVILVPFRPLWSLALFVSSYAIMWMGHFLFERNLPTLFKHPSTPFVIAWAVILRLASPLAMITRGRRGHSRVPLGPRSEAPV
jgi:hypothetical protein